MVAMCRVTVADPGKTIRGGAEFEIFSVRGGGVAAAKALDISSQNLEFDFQ